jgi:hypothetical protein
MISHVHKAIFIHIPKTAGTSVNNILSRNEFKGINYHMAEDGSNDDITGAYKMGVSRRLIRGLSEEWSDYTKFAFVRNPWDRMVSCWKNRAGRYENFNDFVNDYPYKENNHNLVWHTLPQLTHITDEKGSLMIDFIGKFENINTDFKKISSILGDSNLTLPHLNKSERVGYKEYYNNKSIEKVFEIYKDEIRLFGYNF